MPDTKHSTGTFSECTLWDPILFIKLYNFVNSTGSDCLIVNIDYQHMLCLLTD